MSGSSSSVPSGNHFACSVRNVRGMSQPRRCDPARNSSVDSGATGSTGHPHRHVVPAVDVVVGLVLVPRRGLPGSGLLDEHVVVVEPDDGAAHQRPGDVGGLRLERDLPVLLDALPVAEVLDEPARVVVAAGDAEQRPRLGEVALDAGAHGLDLVGAEEPPDDAAAVLAEGGDGLVVDDPAHDRRHSSIPRSRLSLATCPVALTLRKACSMTPAGEMTKVERITPVTTLPYSFFSPYAP